jgi:hypothetical protein
MCSSIENHASSYDPFSARQVDRVILSAERSCVGYPAGAREGPGLVDAREQHGVGGAEDVVGSVAVVRVPVEDQQASCAQ